VLVQKSSLEHIVNVVDESVTGDITNKISGHVLEKERPIPTFVDNSNEGLAVSLLLDERNRCSNFTFGIAEHRVGSDHETNQALKAAAMSQLDNKVGPYVKISSSPVQENSTAEGNNASASVQIDREGNSINSVAKDIAERVLSGSDSSTGSLAHASVEQSHVISDMSISASRTAATDDHNDSSVIYLTKAETVVMAELNSSDMSKMRGNSVAANCKHSDTIDERPKIFVESTKIASSTGGHIEVKQKTLKRPKLSFKELLAKYKKQADAKSASQSDNFKQSRSYPRRDSNGLNRQQENFHISTSFQPYEHPMHMLWGYPPDCAAPRRSTHVTYSNNNNRSNKKKSV
jgi:hypothetical protein